MLTIAVACFLTPTLVSAALTYGLVRWAPAWGLVDHPAARKVHQTPTPLGGGVAIYLAVLLTLGGVALLAWLAAAWPSALAWLPEAARIHLSGIRAKTGLLGLILLAGGIQMALGLADDWRRGGLSYQLRLAVEVVLVAVLASQGIRLSLYLPQWWLTAPITILWIVGLTNALNFLDNMDGLAGGVAFWASAFFVAIALMVGSLFVAGCFLVLLGAVLGFLIFNWSPAKIFMGDAGSNFLGFWLGVLTVISTFTAEGFSHVTILAPLCVLAVPMYDSTSVIVLRLAQGRSPFHPDKQHLSHRLVDLGFKPRHAVLLIHLMTITTGLSGLMLYFIQARAALLVVAQVACMLGIIALLEVSAFRKRRRAAAELEAVAAS